MSESISHQFAEFFCSLKYDSLPPYLTEKIKLCLLDFFGCVIGGTATEPGKIALSYAQSDTSIGRSSIFGIRSNKPAPLAGFVNGILGHALQFDDGERRSGGHPGTVVIPAAFAASQDNNSSPKQLITSVAAGYEAFIRLGKAMHPSHSMRGYHATGTVGAIAAAIAACSVYQLPVKQTIHAIGLSGSIAGGLLEYTQVGDMSTYMVAGNAALTGLQSTLLASLGFTGPPRIIEGEKGLLQVLSDEVIDGFELQTLGKNWELMQVYFKPYPTCRHIHSALDAAISIAQEKEFNPDQIEQITIQTYSLAHNECDMPSPSTIAGLDTSLQFCIASALKYGKYTLEKRSLETLHDPLIKRLANRVNLIVNSEMDKMIPLKRPSIVDVEMENGRSFSKAVDYPRGSPENPLGKKSLKEKFFTCTKKAISLEEADLIQQEILHLEKEQNLKAISELSFLDKSSLSVMNDDKCLYN